MPCCYKPVQHLDFHFSLLVFHFNVPADLHELLSAAKNLPELNIRICDPKLIQIIYKKEVKRIENPYILCCRITYH